jgi:histone acetyltransferase
MTISRRCDDKCNFTSHLSVHRCTLQHYQVLLSVIYRGLNVSECWLDHHFESSPSSPASSVLSDLPQPPTKKRRISTSSQSDTEDAAFLANALDDDDDDDEEDRPLAARMAAIPPTPRPEKSVRMPGKRSGKSIAQPMPKLLPLSAAEKPQINGITNGINGHNLAVKVEDMMDESQLTRLAAGVTVDTAKAATTGVRVHYFLQ